MRIGFDNNKYLEEQSACILERARQFNNKLYLEFGGKLLLTITRLACFPATTRM